MSGNRDPGGAAIGQVAILLGLLSGLALGVLAAVTRSAALLAAAQAVAPLGDAFMRAIQMVVIPLVAVTVFVGVARIASPRQLGRLGGFSLAFFWLTAVVAIGLGMGCMQLALRFTATVPPPSSPSLAVAEAPSMIDFLVGIIPRNPFEAAAAGELLPIIVFTVVCAAATAAIPPERSRMLVELAEALGAVLIKVVGWVLWTAPVGVFGLAAPVAARTGPGMLQIWASSFSR